MSYVNGIDENDDKSKRLSNIELARQQMMLNKEARLAREAQKSVSTEDDFTNNKSKSKFVGDSAQEKQTIHAESYGEGGSSEGARHVGSVIDPSQAGGSNFSGGGGDSSSGGSSHRKGDSFKVESDKLPKGKVKENISLFGD